MWKRSFRKASSSEKQENKEFKEYIHREELRKVDGWSRSLWQDVVSYSYIVHK